MTVVDYEEEYDEDDKITVNEVENIVRAFKNKTTRHTKETAETRSKMGNARVRLYAILQGTRLTTGVNKKIIISATSTTKEI